VGLPRPITDAEVIERGAGDLAVRLRLDDGTCHTFGGQDYYDPPRPFADAADVFFFLVTLNTPAPVMDRALTAADPNWEAKVQAYRRANDAASRALRSGARAAPGQPVTGVVAAHRKWGLEVALDQWDETATVDLRHVGDDPIECNPDQWPAVGTRVHGIVLVRTPNGQLRVSLRLSDQARHGDG